MSPSATPAPSPESDGAHPPLVEVTAGPDDRYEPGVCNIGPSEIARRRRTGHVGAVASGALLGGLVAARAPRAVRLLVAVPAGLAASGYLQARLHFCAGFGARGVFNFERVGPTTTVSDETARARDRRRSLEIGLASLAIAAAAGAAAALLPVGRGPAGPRENVRRSQDSRNAG